MTEIYPIEALEGRGQGTRATPALKVLGRMEDLSQASPSFWCFLGRGLISSVTQLSPHGGLCPRVPFPKDTSHVGAGLILATLS